jgi:hypothetical protein
MEVLDKNKDVILNFGLIAVGPLREIEKLQQLIIRECRNLRIVYQTVSAKKLKLVKLPPVGSEPTPIFGIQTTFRGDSQHETGKKQA